jgi:hypothetical protein
MKNYFSLVSLTILSLAFCANSHAQQYIFDKKIPIPGDGGYDYLAIDEVNDHLFVSHGTSFNVVDLKTETPIATIDGMKGVHGIAIVNEVNKGFISDGRANSVVVVDLTSFATHELCYPEDHRPQLHRCGRDHLRSLFQKSIRI